MTKLNTHALLKEYHGRSNYPEIARYAASFTKGKNKIYPEQLLSFIAIKFGKITLPTYNKVGNSKNIQVFGELGGLIPWNAYQQMQDCMGIPPAIRGAIMPDAHKGYGLPIGGVIELDNAVSPGYIGYDISCMVMLSVFDVSIEEFKDNKKSFATTLKDSTSFGLGSAPDELQKHQVMINEKWNVFPAIKNLQALAHQQLGSSGGGNHFADIVIVTDSNHDKQRLGLLTHSGSRGTGHKLATHYVKLAEQETKNNTRGVPKGHGWLQMDSDLGKEYWYAMQLMGEYAKANHEIIHNTFSKKVATHIEYTQMSRHNFAWDEGNGIFTHRKGATPAHDGELGLIPGTSSSPSWITMGLGHTGAINSSSHGAGRPFSRTEAKKQFHQENYTSHKKDIIHIGVNKDEVQGAYKDIYEVMAKQEGILVDIVGKLTPKVVIMGGKSDDGD